MKKTISVFALAALFVSCSKEAEQTPTTSGDVITVAPTEFYATLETPEPDTKTALGGTNGKQVLWESGDSISVWHDVFAQAKYTLSAGAGTTSATFTSTQTVTGEQQGMFTIVLYPYDADVELGFNKQGRGLSLSNVQYPAVQNYRANSWDKGAMPMFGELDAEGNSLQLRNLAGVLRLTLKGTAKIDSIRVSALGENEYIAGVILDPLSGERFTSGEKTVTLNCGESGVTLSENTGTVFNIVIPPIKGGFKVAICDSKHGVMILQSSSEIKRNTILNMPVVDYAPNAKDLGLSVYWATCNVGATTPEGYGDYFAWGETVTKKTYDWSTYTWSKGTHTDLTKYNTDSSYGTVDNKTTLEPEDDAATQNCGSAWRMPTSTEFEELRTNCTWTTSTDGVKGYKVISKVEGYTDVAIFLPTAGYRSGAYLYEVGRQGGYWSSSRSQMNYASYLSGVNMDDYGARCIGFSVRPVAE